MWVGGSIQGAQLGALLSAVLSIVVMRNAWNKDQQQALGLQIYLNISLCLPIH